MDAPTCDTIHECLPPTVLGQSYGLRTREPVGTVRLVPAPGWRALLGVPWMPLAALENRLSPGTVARTLEVVERPGTRCTFQVRVPEGWGQGDIRDSQGPPRRLLSGTWSEVLRATPGTHPEIRWLGDDRFESRIEFDALEGRHLRLAFEERRRER